jgi:pimeloyl-ACP methyl ester carboxylesterase
LDVATLNDHRQTANTASGPVSYVDVGRGRPAVFVHGILTNSALWRRVIGAVAGDDRRCVALDLPGHGHTPHAPADADVSLPALAQRVVELCDHLGLQRFDLVANDTGGAVAQLVAARLNDRLSTLTLTNCDTEGNTPPKLFKPVVRITRPKLLGVLGPRIATRPALVRLLLTAGYRHAGRIPDDVVECYGTPVFGSASSAKAFARLMSALSSDDLAAIRPELGRLRVPTLIVWGTGDVFFPIKWGRQLAELIPGTTLRTIDGARMHFPDERAEEFVPLLRAHWARTRS